ncbi:MAG: hypothetical protein ACKVRP_14140 [Bacteroidota bacterium]
MSGHQSYIVRLLRQVENSLDGSNSEYARGILGKVIHRIAHASSLPESLESLYSVEGYDEFALRLMWVLERAGVSTDDLALGVMDYDVAQLGSAFQNAVTGRSPASLPQISPQAVQSLEDFYEALHSFGRSVEDFKRRCAANSDGVSIDHDAFYRLLNHAGLVEIASLAVGKVEVAVFAAAVSKFIHHVLDKELFHDVRVMNILENANLTLQTATESTGGEDFDSLQQMTALLVQPSELLE